VLGHFRYSTSSLEHNQPIFEDHTSIAHNGVVSQAEPDTWAENYGLTCKGRNDSELVLRAILAGKEPLDYFPEASMAVCQIRGETLSFYRNGKRPLWYNIEMNSLVVASTRDILKRAGLKENLSIECIPGNKYSWEGSSNLEIRSIVEIEDDWQRKTL
jgi:glutamine phosphoribosylpyrophosphate amidotransferase